MCFLVLIPTGEQHQTFIPASPGAKSIHKLHTTVSLKDSSRAAWEPRGAAGWSRAEGVSPPATCHGLCVVQEPSTHSCPPTVGLYLPCRAPQPLPLRNMEQEWGLPASSCLGRHGKGCVCLVQAFPIQKPLQFKNKSNQIKSSRSTQATGMQLSLLTTL